MHGYWDIPQPMVQRLARVEYGLAQSGSSFSEFLLALVQRALGCDEDEALQCLDRCVDFMSPAMSLQHEEMLQSEGADQCLSEDDWKDAQKAISGNVAARGKVEALQGFTAPRVRPPKPAKKKFKGSTTTVPPKDEDLTEKNLAACLPPSARIRQDLFNGRWEVYHRSLGGKWRSASRSWGSRSHRECVTELLLWAWQQETAKTGIACPVGGLQAPQ